MLNRRQTIALFAPGSSAAAATPPLHAQADGAARATPLPTLEPPDTDQAIPPFSRAALGDLRLEAQA